MGSAVVSDRIVAGMAVMNATWTDVARRC